MTTTTQLAKHFREVFFGGNWCTVSLKPLLADVDYHEATKQVHSFNTILALTYHMGYYVTVVLRVLRGGQLDAHDKFSFDHPEVLRKRNGWSCRKICGPSLRLLPRSWSSCPKKSYGRTLPTLSTASISGICWVLLSIHITIWDKWY